MGAMKNLPLEVERTILLDSGRRRRIERAIAATRAAAEAEAEDAVLAFRSALVPGFDLLADEFDDMADVLVPACSTQRGDPDSWMHRGLVNDVAHWLAAIVSRMATEREDQSIAGLALAVGFFDRPPLRTASSRCEH